MQGILLELPLAAFFVKKLLGRACDVNDLPSLDPQLYASLMALRSYQGNVEDLALCFSIADSSDPSREVQSDEQLLAGGFVNALYQIKPIHHITAGLLLQTPWSGVIRRWHSQPHLQSPFG